MYVTIHKLYQPKNMLNFILIPFGIVRFKISKIQENSIQQPLSKYIGKIVYLLCTTDKLFGLDLLM